jgi:hypothetical protein
VLKRPAKDSMATLVHEMAHQWEQDHGTPPRKGYHDTQWARKMWEIGLIPSDTGQPGGKETGQKMDHYIDPAGKFMKVFRAMPDECKLPWLSGGANVDQEPKKKPPKKIKLTCPECERTCWVADGRSPDEVDCGDCDQQMLTKEELKERKENDRG